MRVIGLAGKAGSGKDTVADILVDEYNYVRIGLADPLKRMCMDIYGWDPEVLWGPSQNRDKQDPKRKRSNGAPLTARHALQTLGTEWGRECYENTWIDLALDTASALERGVYSYTPQSGIQLLARNVRLRPYDGVVIPDIRFDNEAQAILNCSGSVWLVERAGAGLQGEAGQHASEAGLKPENVTFTLSNDDTIQALHNKVREALRRG